MTSAPGNSEVFFWLRMHVSCQIAMALLCHLLLRAQGDIEVTLWSLSRDKENEMNHNTGTKNLHPEVTYLTFPSFHWLKQTRWPFLDLKSWDKCLPAVRNSTKRERGIFLRISKSIMYPQREWEVPVSVLRQNIQKLNKERERGSEQEGWGRERERGILENSKGSS
jgi:hypothetical protein